MPGIYAFADEASTSLSGQIIAMLRNHMQGLEIRGVDGQNVSEISIEKAREVKNRLADNGLVTWSVGSPIGKIDIVKDDFARHMDVLKHTLDVAHELDAKHLRMFSFYIPQGENPAVYRDEVLERLTRMAEAAEGSGVLLCHENEKGGCFVTLAMSDGEGDVINMRLLCGGEEQAKTMEKNFRKNAEAFYQQFIELLSKK